MNLKIKDNQVGNIKLRKNPNLDREQLEYSAQKIFQYGTILLGSTLVYASFAYIVVSYFKKND